jgi:uncharacterized protein (TIGR03437 family)
MSMRFLAVALTVLAGGAFAQPSIDPGRILNTSGDQPVLAPGAVWVIYGKNLGPTNLVAADAPNFPTMVGGTSVTFTPTGSGSPIQAKVWYTLSTQVGGFLPSTAATGTYNVTVSYGGQTSPPQSVTVVARSMGVGTANGLGTGPAQATVANVNNGLSLVRFTSGSFDYLGYHWLSGPTHPGDEVVLWGTGGGADASNDPGPAPSSSGDQTASGNFMVTVGTRQIKPDYAGTVSGSPGLWQINVRLPNDIDLDCFAPVQVTAGGTAGNLTSIAIAAPGATSCTDSQFSQTLLATMDTGHNLIVGAFALAKIGSSPTAASFQETGSGFFGNYTPAELAAPRIGPKFNGCEIYDRTYPVAGTDPGSPDGYVDAGSRLPVSGANFTAGSALAGNSTAKGILYSISPSAGTLTGTSYTLSGTGGNTVAAFSAMTTFPASFTGTNWDSIASVNRANPLTLTWSGTGFNNVYILVNSITTTTTTRRIVTMNCVVPAAPGTYTIPPAALAYLPAVPASGTSFGSITLEAQVATAFTAPLTAGGQIDLGSFAGDFGYTKNIAIQ